MSKSRRTLRDQNGFELNAKDIVRAVNAFDKEFGLKLKDPDIWIEPENYVNVFKECAKNNLAALLVLVNGCVFTEYFNVDSYGFVILKRDVGINHPAFTLDSMLEWDKTNKTYPTDSLIFRCRFVSIILQNILFSFDKIVANRRREYKIFKSENMIKDIKTFMDYITRFVILMIDEQEYDNCILKMHEITSYKYNKVNQKHLKNQLGSKVIYTKKNLRSNLIEGRFYSDDMGISELLKVSYTLTTNATNYDVLPKFKYIEHATLKHDLMLLIEKLGTEIICHNGHKKFPVMFLAFLKASPSIYTQMSRESNANLAIQTGVSALAYTKFVMNSRHSSRFIDEMLKKGI